MKVATIGLMSTALAVSTIGLSGSTSTAHPTAGHSTGAKAAAVANRPR